MIQNFKDGVDVLENIKKDVENQKNNQESKEFKTKLIEKLVKKSKSKANNEKQDNKEEKNKENSDLKDDAIKLSDILKGINLKDISEEEISDICSDINTFKVNVGIDSEAIEILNQDENKENKNLIKLLQGIHQDMNVDIDSISQFQYNQFETINKMCKLGNVYVNSGWDESARKGYSKEIYGEIAEKSQKMIEKAMSKVTDKNNEKEKFMAIYNAVLKAEKYDYSALNSSSINRRIKSRSLEGFFVDGTCVCAGTADALKNLCECIGLEAEYVQGYAKSKKQNNADYHAWIKVKIGDKWFNADPTWDANKVGKDYEFCLKSDNEFYGHNEDKTYNPTYERGYNSKRNYSSERAYKISNESIQKSEIKKYMNSKLLEEKIINNSEYNPTEEDYKYFRENNMPIAGIMKKNQKLTIKQKLAKFFSSMKYFKNFGLIKKFIEKNKIDKVKNNKVENNKVENNKVENNKVENNMVGNRISDFNREVRITRSINTIPDCSEKNYYEEKRKQIVVSKNKENVKEEEKEEL